jgi:hypothetical protein
MKNTAFYSITPLVIVYKTKNELYTPLKGSFHCKVGLLLKKGCRPSWAFSPNSITIVLLISFSGVTSSDPAVRHRPLPFLL